MHHPFTTYLLADIARMFCIVVCSSCALFLLIQAFKSGWKSAAEWWWTPTLTLVLSFLIYTQIYLLGHMWTLRLPLAVIASACVGASTVATIRRMYRQRT